MRVAVPLFGQDVAPRFGFANTFLIAEIEDSGVSRTQEISIDTTGWSSRLGELRDLGIDVLLCGGFNREYAPLAEDFGIDVHAGLTGDAHRVVEAFSRGETMPTFSCSGMGRRRHSKQGCGNGAIGHGRGRNRRTR